MIPAATTATAYSSSNNGICTSGNENGGGGYFSLRHFFFPVFERSTLSGKCYTLLHRCLVQVTSQYTLYFNLSSRPKSDLSVYLHDERGYIALNLVRTNYIRQIFRENTKKILFFQNYWHSPVSVVSAPAGLDTDAMISKTVILRESELTSEEYFRCWDEHRADIVSGWDHKDVCYFPSLGSLLDKYYFKNGTTIPYCRSSRDYFRTQRLFLDLLLLTLESCPKPRREETHSCTALRQETVLPGRRALLRVYYETQDVAVEQEYLLLDLGALLAAVGGFVGMVLGWSLQDCLRLAAPKT